MLDGTVEGFDAYEAALAAALARAARPTRQEGVDMLYSSGTTGRPKGVQVAAARTRRSGTKPALSMVAEGLFAYSDRDAATCRPAPLYHAAPLRFTMGVHRVGGTVVRDGALRPAEARCALIEQHRITHSQWVPTMFIRMLKLPDEERAAYDVSSHGGACSTPPRPCPVEVKRADDRVVGTDRARVLRRHRGQRLRLLQQRGLAGPPRHRRPEPPRARSTSPTTTARSCPPGEPGTIWFEGGADLRVPQRPGEDRRLPPPRRAGRTLGDVGRLDDDGFLYLTDRKAYMIITGGVNVYPQEAENALALHPKVADVAVFGVPNDDFGEEVKAVVQPVDMDEAGRRAGRAS